MVRRLSRKMEQMENSKECTLDEWVRMAREYSTEMKGMLRLCRGCLRVHQIFFIISSIITLIGVAYIILLLKLPSRADKELMESLPAFPINIPISPCIIFLILFPYIVQLCLNIFDFSLVRLLRIDSDKLPTDVHTTLHKFRYVEECLRQNSFPVLDWEDDEHHVTKIISGFIIYLLILFCTIDIVPISFQGWYALLMIFGGYYFGG